MERYPELDEEFEMTMDGDLPENQPLSIHRGMRDGKYIGTPIVGRETHKFKIVNVGYCETLEILQERLLSRGKIAPGQWVKAFKDKYGSNNKGLFSADFSWIDWEKTHCAPMIDRFGLLHWEWRGG